MINFQQLQQYDCRDIRCLLSASKRIGKHSIKPMTSSLANTQHTDTKTNYKSTRGLHFVLTAHTCQSIWLRGEHDVNTSTSMRRTFSTRNAYGMDLTYIYVRSACSKLVRFRVRSECIIRWLRTPRNTVVCK